MRSSDLKARLTAVEAELERIKARLGKSGVPWWETISGTFRDDPLHAAAMKIARAQRRRQHASRPGTNGRPRHRSAQSA
jgi:hypothetical protein